MKRAFVGLGDDREGRAATAGEGLTSWLLVVEPHQAAEPAPATGVARVGRPSVTRVGGRIRGRGSGGCRWRASGGCWLRPGWPWRFGWGWWRSLRGGGGRRWGG